MTLYLITPPFPKLAISCLRACLILTPSKKRQIDSGPSLPKAPIDNRRGKYGRPIPDSLWTVPLHLRPLKSESCGGRTRLSPVLPVKQKVAHHLPLPSGILSHLVNGLDHQQHATTRAFSAKPRRTLPRAQVLGVSDRTAWTTGSSPIGGFHLRS
jgi:hypothetical protein